MKNNIHTPAVTLGLALLACQTVSSADAQNIERKVLEEAALWGFTPKNIDAELGDFKVTAYSDVERLPWSGQVQAQPYPDGCIKLKAWRGERVNAQILIQSAKELKQVRLATSPLSSAAGKMPLKAQFVKFTQARKTPYADIVCPEGESLSLNPAGVNRSVWVSVDVPQNAKAGVYKAQVSVKALGQETQKVDVLLEVLPQVLPPTKDWGVHLDLWQHPDAVARWHDVDMWSPEHFALLKPLMQRLADAGQKTITATLIDEAWGGQTYDKFVSMIEWIKQEDGTMRWDYSNFDKYIDFMMNEVGIKDQISCYTMIPWSKILRVYNEKSGEYEFLPCEPTTPAYEKMWGPFITDFAKHVKAKGWEKICHIGIDERPEKWIADAKRILDTYGPNFKIVSAVNYASKASDITYDMSPSLEHSNELTPELIATRRAEGKKTTFYVCCNPKKPNTFTHSPLVESEWLGMYAAANDFDGFLRWAYNSWNINPYSFTDFGTWTAGDTFLVYPNNKTSLRFEKLRDGIEAFEKLNILRAQAKSNPALAAKLKGFEEELRKRFDRTKPIKDSYAADVLFFQEGIEALSR